MHIYRFLFLLLTAAFPLLTAAQCTISNTSAEFINCDDNDRFSALLSFDVENQGPAGFQVLGNGTNYGTFAYADLPLTLSNLDGDCATDYQFVVRDVTNPACSNFIELGTICCELGCTIEATLEGAGDCNATGDGTDVTVSIVYEGVQPLTNVTVFGEEGFVVELPADSFPATITNVLTGTDELSILIVCETGTDCCDTLMYNNPCVCSIFDPQTNVVDCSEADSTYYLEIDFDHFMTSDSFLLGYSGTLFGTFAYADLPVTVGPLPLSEVDDVEVLAVDQVRNLCFDGIEVGVVDDCNVDCIITSLFAEAYGCDDGMYSVDVEFTADNVAVGQEFTIRIGSSFLDTLLYGDDIYTIAGLTSNEQQTVVVAILGDSLCQDFVVLESFECSDCSLLTLSAAVTCAPFPTLSYTFTEMDSSELYYVLIDADTVGIWPIDSIDISSYADGTYQLQLADVADSNCAVTTAFTLDCPVDTCSIAAVTYQYERDCTTDELFIDVDVTATGTSDSIAFAIDGLLVGVLPYDTAAIRLGPLPLDCMTDYTLIVADNVNAGCFIATQLIDIPCCVCDIGIDSTSLECLEGEVAVTFAGVSALSAVADSFVLYSPLGENTYAYSDVDFTEVYPLESSVTVVAADANDDSCRDSLIIDTSVCIEDCSLEITTAMVDSCFGFEFDVTIDLAHEGTSEFFVITGNGFDYGQYAYSDLPIVLTDLEANTSLEYEFVVTDSESSACMDSIYIGVVACITSTKELQPEDVSILLSSLALHIELSLNTATVQVFSTKGEQVVHQEITKGSTRLSLADYPVGIYFINVTSARKSTTKKIFLH